MTSPLGQRACRGSAVRFLTEILPLLLAIGAITLTIHWEGDDHRAVAVQAVCLIAALAWTASQPCPRSPLPTRRHEVIGILLLWCAVVFARFYLFRLLPPANQTGFEELQTGGIAHRMLAGGLPLEFRFTNLFATLGFRLGGENLVALRAPFFAQGVLALLLLVSTLRELGVGWSATIVTCLTAATLRWLVIANVADELFASLWIATAIVWCLVRFEHRPEQAGRWAALTGVLAGLLMFEYTSYRVMIILAGAWLLWRTLTASSGRFRLHRQPLVAFLVAFTATSAPMLVDVVRHPNSTIFFEAFRRHEGERKDALSPETLDHLKQYTMALGGGLSSANQFLTPSNEPVIPPLVGVLMIAGAAAAAVNRRRPIARALAATMAFTIVTASLTANNAVIGRISPLLPLLMVTLGVFLDEAPGIMAAARAKIRRGRHLNVNNPPTGSEAPQFQGPRKARGKELLFDPMTIALAGLALAIIVLNVAAVQRMASSRAVLLEYCNDDYATAYWIGQTARPGQTVVVVTPDTGQGWLAETDMMWLYASKNVALRGYGKFPSPHDIPPGALVAVGVRSRGLSDQELRPLRDLAKAAGVPGAVRLRENSAHNQSVATFGMPRGIAR